MFSFFALFPPFSGSSRPSRFKTHKPYVWQPKIDRCLRLSMRACVCARTVCLHAENVIAAGPSLLPILHPVTGRLVQQRVINDRLFL